MNHSFCVVELKWLALKCEFGVFREEGLCDCPVCGLENVQIQKKLLAERDLTFKKAFETVQSMEMANEEDVCDVSSPQDESLNKVSKFNNVVVNIINISHRCVGSELCSASNVRERGMWPRCAVSRNENPSLHGIFRMFHRG